MVRLNTCVRLAIAWTILATGSGTLTAGVFDFLKTGGKKPAKNVVVRAQAQEPNPAPPAPLDLGGDPAYAQPVLPTPMTTPSPMAATSYPPSPTMDCAPQFSGFSDGGACHACPGCREPESCCCCDNFTFKMGRASRRLSGQSYYCDCYPLFGPRYGFYTTCWRRLPEDCRCPIYLPPRKAKSVPDAIPTDNATPPAEPQVPPPPGDLPQALNLR